MRSTSFAYGRGVATDGSVGVYMAGDFDGMAQFGNDTLISGSWSDMFLVRYSSDGNCEGVRQYTYGHIAHFTVDYSGNVNLAGTFKNTLNIGPNTFISYGDDDLFVAKCSAITGIEEKPKSKQPQLFIYANPTNGKCTITLPNDFKNGKNLLLQIFDSQGKMIQKIPIEVSDEKIGVDISEEAKGIYYLILSNGKKNYSGKIIFE